MLLACTNGLKVSWAATEAQTNFLCIEQFFARPMTFVESYVSLMIIMDHAVVVLESKFVDNLLGLLKIHAF